MKIKYLSGVSFFLLFISIISLLSSCTSNDSYVVKNIKVDVDKCDLSALEDNVSIRKIVQLDNTYPLGNVSKALIVEDKIFIQDKQCEQIIGFNQQGKFLFKIADLGKGPKEYTHIQSFFVDRFNNKIKVLEGTGKILSYDFDGNFISVFNGKEKNCFKQIMNAIQLNKPLWTTSP
ncbi:MAG: 6-bladed beta-propeller [Nitrososphaeraceae archaeon]